MSTVFLCSIHHVQVRRAVKIRHHLHAHCKFHLVGNPHVRAVSVVYIASLGLRRQRNFQIQIMRVNPSLRVLDSAVTAL